VLGAIDPEERLFVDAHLTGCSDCRNELNSLARLPALLGLVTLEQVEDAASAPPDLRDRILARAADDRRKRRRRFWMGAAAAVVALAAVLGGGFSLLRDRGGASELATSLSVSAIDPHTHVRGSIGLVRREWGTAVTLRLAGVTPWTRCRLIAVGRSGEQEIAGTWRVAYEGKATLIGATAIARRDLTRFDIVTVEGQVLLSIPAA
jgi:hypothetical protein